MAENTFLSCGEYNDAAGSSITLVEDRPQISNSESSNSDQPGVPRNLTTSCGHSMSGRNLVVCIDGTSNQFGEQNTNVIELYNLILKEEEHNQRTWYNSGIGTYARPSWKSLKFYKQVLYHKIDLAIAWNFEQTILSAYRWLSDNYRKGDCIFLFGMSVGLIYKGNELQIPFAYELYADLKSDKVSTTQVGSQKEMSMAERFKSAFCHKDVKVHFVGAWDTVSSIGLVRGKHMLPRTVDGMTHVCYFRHALALDERRVKFLPEYAWEDPAKDPAGREPLDTDDISSSENKEFEMACMGKDGGVASPDKTVPLKKRPHTLEVWFAGTHSDMGNVYNTALDRSRPPLRWMVFEAGAVGLRTSPFERELALEEQIEIKESLTWAWRPFELLPFKRLTFTRKKGIKQHTTSRKIRQGQKIHSSLLVGKTNVPYIPKARPFDDNVLFWKNLPREWLELDLYEYAEDLLRRFATDASKTLHAYETLRQIAISSDGQQALYEKVADVLSSGTLALEARYRLLRFSLDTFNKHQLILKPSINIRPFIMDFQLVAKEFLVSLTDPLISVLSVPKANLRSIGIIPHSDHIYSTWYDNDVRTLDAKTGKQLSVMREPIKDARYSPDGKYIALVLGTLKNKSITIRKMETGKPIGRPFGQDKGMFSSIAFSPDGRLLASTLNDSGIRLWDVESQQQFGNVLKTSASVNCIAFSPNGRYLVAGLGNCDVQIWDVEHGKQMPGIALSGHTDRVLSAKFSSDGRYLVSGSLDGTIRIWDAVKGTSVREPLRGHAMGVRDAMFSPDGKYVISASMDRTVQVWDATTGKQMGQPLKGHKGWVRSVAFSHDGAYLMSGSDDGTIRIWDAKAVAPV
ncbi:quinon protein alcohol dehydrogenase-like superfamily [Gymnopilus junonius]|uniref:Quinon protein alcohol dehydrogenase-like superfamily n=1 Tax=Gymnopilus junonius TaxID=109634 RepID=A0A9P5NXJ6_GYMJU|nr:quinon protein alcohol dehydrogenase-like superfamily [Gymnopilus junonius]